MLSGSWPTLHALLAWRAAHGWDHGLDTPGPAGLTPLHLAALVPARPDRLLLPLLLRVKAAALLWFHVGGEAASRTPAQLALALGRGALNAAALQALLRVMPEAAAIVEAAANGAVGAGAAERQQQQEEGEHEQLQQDAAAQEAAGPVTTQGAGATAVPPDQAAQQDEAPARVLEPDATMSVTANTATVRGTASDASTCSTMAATSGQARPAARVRLAPVALLLCLMLLLLTKVLAAVVGYKLTWWQLLDVTAAAAAAAVVLAVTCLTGGGEREAGPATALSGLGRAWQRVKAASKGLATSTQQLAAAGRPIRAMVTPTVLSVGVMLLALALAPARGGGAVVLAAVHLHSSRLYWSGCLLALAASAGSRRLPGTGGRLTVPGVALLVCLLAAGALPRADQLAVLLLVGKMLQRSGTEAVRRLRLLIALEVAAVLARAWGSSGGVLVATLPKVLVLAQLHVLLLCLVPTNRLAKKAERPDSGPSSSSGSSSNGSRNGSAR